MGILRGIQPPTPSGKRHRTGTGRSRWESVKPADETGVTIRETGRTGQWPHCQRGWEKAPAPYPAIAERLTAAPRANKGTRQNRCSAGRLLSSQSAKHGLGGPAFPQRQADLWQGPRETPEAARGQAPPGRDNPDNREPSARQDPQPGPGGTVKNAANAQVKYRRGHGPEGTGEGARQRPKGQAACDSLAMASRLWPVGPGRSARAKPPAPAVKGHCHLATARRVSCGHKGTKVRPQPAAHRPPRARRRRGPKPAGLYPPPGTSPAGALGKPGQARIPCRHPESRRQKGDDNSKSGAPPLGCPPLWNRRTKR